MQDENRLKRYNKIIITLSLMILLMLLFLIVRTIVNNSNKLAYLDILVTPVDAIIMIDDNEYGNAAYEFEPGKYTAMIMRDGFKDKTVELDLERGKTTGLYLFLEPTNDRWAFYEERKNEVSLDVLLRLGGYDDKGEKNKPALVSIDNHDYVVDFMKKISIKSIMPIDVPICGEPATRMNCDSINVIYDYSQDCNDELCLIISGRSLRLNEQILSRVKAEVENKGYGFDNYKYIYRYDINK